MLPYIWEKKLNEVIKNNSKKEDYKFDLFNAEIQAQISLWNLLKWTRNYLQNNNIFIKNWNFIYTKNGKY